MKKRWSLGAYALKYNPKSHNQDLSSTQNTNIAANGLVTTNNYYYEKSSQFTFDVYEKPFSVEKIPFITFGLDTYQSIAEKRATEEIFALRGLVVDVFNNNGSKLRQFNTNTVSGGASIAISITDDHVIVFYNNATLVIQDENNVQNAKYNYSGISDLNNVSSIVYQYDSHNIYALNKFGRLYLLQDNSATYQLVFEFGDYTANQSANISKYTGLHFVNGYVGLVKTDTNKTYYFNGNYELVYATELQAQNVKSISYGFNSKKIKLMTRDKILNAHIDLCGLDIDMIKGQIAKGVVILTDDNNMSKSLFVSGAEVKRVRNKQDSRFEVTISGKIM